MKRARKRIGHLMVRFGYWVIGHKESIMVAHGDDLTRLGRLCGVTRESDDAFRRRALNAMRPR